METSIAYFFFAAADPNDENGERDRLSGRQNPPRFTMLSSCWSKRPIRCIPFHARTAAIVFHPSPLKQFERAELFQNFLHNKKLVVDTIELHRNHSYAVISIVEKGKPIPLLRV